MPKRLLIFIFLIAATLRAATAPARTVELAGTATNTTADVSAAMHLTLVITGENVTAQLRTEAPLSGSGKLTGRFVGGWCELEGQLAEGFAFKLHGVLNARDFRGLYLAAVPGVPLQYGKFLLVPPAAKTSDASTKTKP